MKEGGNFLNIYSWIYLVSCCYERLKRKFYIRYNKWLFKKNGIVFGDGMKVYNKVYIQGSGTVTIGHYFTFTSGDGLNPVCTSTRGCMNTVNKGSIIIGNSVGISSATLWAQEMIRIGNHVNIGGNCILIDNDAHPIDFKLRRDPVVDENVHSSPIIIEDDVWIGANSVILKGVTVGARSIIGAGSVVTTNVPSDCVVAGNPAKIIKRIEQ